MSHLDEGTILSLRDGLAPEGPVQVHLAACSSCAATLAGARARASLIADALATLDAPIDLAQAKAATRAELDQMRPPKVTPAWRRWPLGRAAALLVVTAGAASALTLTPLRHWWSIDTSSTRPASTTAPDEASVPAATPPQLSETTGIAVDVGASLHVIVRGVDPGALIDVVWVDDTTARAVGRAGTGFTYGDGRLEVDVSEGDLRLEVPRSIGSTIEVDGRVWIERSEAGLEIYEPTLARSNERVSFSVPTR